MLAKASAALFSVAFFILGLLFPPFDFAPEMKLIRLVFIIKGRISLVDFVNHTFEELMFYQETFQSMATMSQCFTAGLCPFALNFLWLFKLAFGVVCSSAFFLLTLAAMTFSRNFRRNSLQLLDLSDLQGNLRPIFKGIFGLVAWSWACYSPLRLFFSFGLTFSFLLLLWILPFSILVLITIVLALYTIF